VIPEWQSMEMRKDAPIPLDRIKTTLELQAENLRLILRSKRQIAPCTRNASRRAEIAGRRISARDIAARSAEIRRATEGTHASQ
jgi:hypothetical protein